MNKKNKALARDLWLLSYPTMISFAMQSAYDIVDIAWVGQISKEALSGVTLFSTIYFLFTVLNEIAGAGSVSMISQTYGRGDRERTQKISEQTISFKIVLAILSGCLLFLFLQPLLNLYSDDSRVIQAAMDYGYIRIFFLPMMFSSYSVNTIFRCTQDSKTPMKIMLISAILNLILDPVLMFKTIPGTSIPGFNLGVFGAALATVIASSISFLYGFYVLYSGKRDVTISFRGMLKLDREIDSQLLVIGLPTGLQMFVRQAFNAVMIKFVTDYGNIAIALAGIMGKLANFYLMPIFGLTMAGATLAGSSLGRNNIQEAERVTKMSAYMNTAIVSLIVAISALFPREIMQVFSQENEVISAGVDMIRIVALGMVIVAYSFGIKVAFNASGYNQPQLYSTLISRWAVQLPLMYLVVYIFEMELNYLWWCMVIAEIADLLITLYYYKKGNWKFNRV